MDSKALHQLSDYAANGFSQQFNDGTRGDFMVAGPYASAGRVFVRMWRAILSRFFYGGGFSLTLGRSFVALSYARAPQDDGAQVQAYAYNPNLRRGVVWLITR